MPPQKRGRNSDKQHEDAEMADGAPAPASANGAASDSDDSDSDDDDDLTFNENMNADEDDDDDEDDEEDDDAMDGGAQGAAGGDDRTVSVDFVFQDPREEHYHSVKQFLLPYLPSSQPFNVSGLADLVVGQVAVGTMVCAEGEPDVYGFTTALSLQRYKDDASLAQVLQYATKRCPASDAARLQKLLASKSVALVLNQRMVNLPYQLVPPLHSALHEDIEWAVDNEETPELRKSFQFDYFLLLSSCTMEKSGAAPAGKGKGKKSKTMYEQTAKYFVNFEDEFLEAEAELSYTFETPLGERERDTTNTLITSNKHTTVMLIERSRHKAALASIAAMINA